MISLEDGILDLVTPLMPWRQVDLYRKPYALEPRSSHNYVEVILKPEYVSVSCLNRAIAYLPVSPKL